MGINCDKFVVPFLMGQRRDGLCRIQDLSPGAWELVDVPEFDEHTVDTSDEMTTKMGKVYGNLSDRVEWSASRDMVPLSVAGDCVSALGVLAGLQKAGREPDYIVWLDAHGDFHTWETSQTKYIGGMSLAMLTGRGDRRIADAVDLVPYSENRIVLSDARDLDSGEREALLNSAIVRCPISEVLEHLQPDGSIYLHWDTDVVDARKEMPALKYHVGSGPSIAEMRALFRSLGQANITAISVSAWHEEQDFDNETAAACLTLLGDLGVDLELCDTHPRYGVNPVTAEIAQIDPAANIADQAF